MYLRVVWELEFCGFLGRLQDLRRRLLVMYVVTRRSCSPDVPYVDYDGPISRRSFFGLVLARGWAIRDSNESDCDLYSGGGPFDCVRVRYRPRDVCYST